MDSLVYMLLARASTGGFEHTDVNSAMLFACHYSRLGKTVPVHEWKTRLVLMHANVFLFLAAKLEY